MGLGLTTPSALVGDSGGHFNPAVSLAAMLVGGLHLTMLLPYWISQLCGGLIGAALAKVGEAQGGWAGGFGSDGATGVSGVWGVETVQFFSCCFQWDWVNRFYWGGDTQRAFGFLQTHPVLSLSGHSPPWRDQEAEFRT